LGGSQHFYFVWKEKRGGPGRKCHTPKGSTRESNVKKGEDQAGRRSKHYFWQRGRGELGCKEELAPCKKKTACRANRREKGKRREVSSTARAGTSRKTRGTGRRKGFFERRVRAAEERGYRRGWITSTETLPPKKGLRSSERREHRSRN